jgi:hypothetical protein
MASHPIDQMKEQGTFEKICANLSEEDRAIAEKEARRVITPYLEAFARLTAALKDPDMRAELAKSMNISDEEIAATGAWDLEGEDDVER